MGTAGVTSGERLLAAVVAVVCMWIAAWFAVVVGLVAPMRGFESGDPESGELLSRVAFAGAVLLFLTSGPVGYWISRRRWTLLSPLALVAVAAVGVLIAGAT
jgi:hypothetical protein